MSLFRTSLIGLACALAATTFASNASAQIETGGRPLSLEQNLASDNVPTQLMPVVETLALMAEDEAQRASGKVGPWRFGTEFPVDLSLDNSGAWQDLQNGDRLWRLRIDSPGAFSLNMIFENFWMPPGAQLFVYNDDHSWVAGAFTELNNEDHGQFAIQPIMGSALTLEYYEPRMAPAGVLRIGQVIHAYRDIYADMKSGPTQGGSGACEINVACPLGANYQDQIRSVSRLVMGGVLCTGSLVANATFNGTQYYMTANHCYSGNPATWVFQFNYQSATCNGTTGSPQSVTGSTLKVKHAGADFCLVQITPTIPAGYNVFLAGWSRSSTNPTMGTCVHHPQGDIKKISQDVNSLTKVTTGGAQCWRVAVWEQAATEPGSSGSPIYDENKRFRGQLYGGASYCGFPFDDYYGRMDIAFGLGAAAFLDPNNTGVIAIDGHNPGQGGSPSTYCTAKTNSTGNSMSLTYSGSQSAAANNFRIQISFGVPNKTGVPFRGLAQASTPFMGGFLCVQPPVVREAQFTTDIVGFADEHMPFDVSMVGVTHYYQIWVRDPANPDGTFVDLSGGMAVPVIP